MDFKITLIAILFFIAALFVLAWIVVEIGKKCRDEAMEYEKRYARIKELVEKSEVCEANYDWLLKLLEGLGQLPYKNRELTQVLTVQFFMKYKAIAEKQVKENS